MASQAVYQTFRGELTPILQLFQKTAEERKLLNLSYEATITLIPKLDQAVSREWGVRTHHAPWAVGGQVEAGAAVLPGAQQRRPGHSPGSPGCSGEDPWFPGTAAVGALPVVDRVQGQGSEAAVVRVRKEEWAKGKTQGRQSAGGCEVPAASGAMRVWSEDQVWSILFRRKKNIYSLVWRALALGVQNWGA